MIYFIEAVGANAVKIGFTEQKPEDRLAALQTGCPHPLRLMGVMDGDVAEERRLHARFKRLRTTGEWFKLDDELRFLAITYQIEKRIRVLERAIKSLLPECECCGESMIVNNDGDIVCSDARCGEPADDNRIPDDDYLVPDDLSDFDEIPNPVVMRRDNFTDL